MVRFFIIYKREKGPRTPNFRKLSEMLQDKTPIKIPIDRNSVMYKHGAIGLKMNFVCDIIEELQRLSKSIKLMRKGNIISITQKEFYSFIFNLDIYIFELYSILDYFALEVGEISKLKKKAGKKMVDIEYFQDFKRAVGFSPIIKQKVDNFMKRDWFKYFHEMRRRVVHRLPINLWGLIYGDIVEFPFFPDEPLNIKSISKKKLAPLTECKKWLEEVFNFIDDICGDLGRKLFDDF